MDLREMTVEQLEERKAAIAAEVDAEGADLDALEEEVRAIKEELENRAAEAAKKEEIRKAIAEGKVGEKIVEQKIDEGRKEMKTNDEVRASEAYINAFARYLVTEDATECRSLLTENVGGSVPVPTFVDEKVQTAWEDNKILDRVRKTYLRGNLSIPFERVASDAVEHTEGSGAIDEETLKFGIVKATPKNIKKFVRLSDEDIAMGGRYLVDYVYDELIQKIMKKLADLVVNDIATASTSATSTAACVAEITSAPTVTAVATAFANLSDEATDPVVIMNKLTYASFKQAQAQANFAVDPFEGLPVLYSNKLKAYSAASNGDVYAIVGDLNGVTVNYPEGEGIVTKYDDISEAEYDMVKIHGRQYAAHALTACGRFCNIKKGS